jgi:ABC-2 type transport system permease protein
VSVIYIMWLRELRRYTRSRTQLIASLGQPLLYLLALGFGLGPVFQKAGQGNYVQFIAPGVIAMTVLFSSVLSGIGLLFDRQFGFLKETLVAPVPRFQVMFGRTLGASTVAVIQGTLVMVVCFIAGFRVVNWALFPLAFLFMGMIACLFASLGTAIGSALENMQGFQLIMNFLVMPMFFLSGALYPIDNLPKVFSRIVSIDPLAYGVDALRAVLTARSFYGLGMDVTVMAIVAFVFLLIGTRMFSKIQV